MIYRKESYYGHGKNYDTLSTSNTTKDKVDNTDFFHAAVFTVGKYWYCAKCDKRLFKDEAVN